MHLDLFSFGNVIVYRCLLIRSMSIQEKLKKENACFIKYVMGQ